MVIADKAYEANDLIQMIPDRGAMVVRPVGSNRNQQPESDDHCYKDRNLVERFCHKIKQFGHIVRGDEKQDRNLYVYAQLGVYHHLVGLNVNRP